MVRLLFIVFLMVSVNSIAQDTTGLVDRPKWLVKWNPLSLFDIESRLQIASEYRLTPRSAVQVEVGYGFPFLNNLSVIKQSSLSNRQAWQFRTEYRYYRRAKSQAGKYWALEGFAKTVNGLSSIYVSDVDGGRNAPVQFPIHKRVVGGHLKVGVQRPFNRRASPPGRTRFLYDFSMGFGLRYTRTVAESVNVISYIHPSGGLFDAYSPGHELTPSATIGLKIAYQLQ